MKQNVLTGIFISLISLSVESFAGTDPIGWSLSPPTGFPPTMTLGSSYAITYTLTNNLPFAVPLTVSANYTGGTFTVSNNCNKTLAAKNSAGSSCTVYVAYLPIKSGLSSIQLIMAYHKNRVPLPKLQFTAAVPLTDIVGHITNPLPALTYIGGDYPVTFTYTNRGITPVTPTTVNITNFTVSSNTCLTALAPNATCLISGIFSPSALGPATLGTTYVYNNGSDVSVPLVSQTEVISGECRQVEGLVRLPLPAATYQYADNVVQYIFTNVCPSTSETLGTVTLTADSAATITKGTDTCSGTTLGPNTSCSIYASLVPTSVASDLSLSASLPYNNNSSIATATTSETVNPIANQSTLHTVYFVNQCDQNIWYEFQNGAGGITGKSPDPTPAGQRTFQDYQLNAQLPGSAPATKVLIINEYVNGAIYGRTGCNPATGVCETANCLVIPGTATCQVGVGANNPCTIFETNMTAAAASDGVYDISIINGFNIPGQVKSLAPIGTNPFGCGQSAGAVIQPTGSLLGQCPWSFNPPSSGIDSTANYYAVSGGADDGCPISTTCTTGEYCGMAYSTTTPGTAPINRRCGTFLGYWTLADYIGYSSTMQWGTVNLYLLYDMGTALPAGPDGPYGDSTSHAGVATYSDMYGCILTSNHSLNSGYAFTQNVCGCYNWNQSGSVAPTTQESICTGSNSQWITTVFPRIYWLKQACPTAYSYQYDDKSVSFTCNVTNPTPQKTSYQITFCPAGKSGRPGT